MSIDKEKKPAKAPAKPKKAVAGETKTKAAAKPKAEAAPKKAAPKAKTAAKSAVAAGVPEAAAAFVAQPTHAEISYRAYGYFLERHGQHGYHEQDWLRAERELLGLGLDWDRPAR
jgi:outer membrane biosynthesis protein TonB